MLNKFILCNSFAKSITCTDLSSEPGLLGYVYRMADTSKQADPLNEM